MRTRVADGWRLILIFCACVLALAGAAQHLPGQPQSESLFASRIEQFSEPGGYFDTDNLISNEQSYLHPLDALRARRVSGGVYIGVGPDQNFSYIAQVRPAVAFIVDIRRDNLLLHLLLKAIFSLSRDRLDYLSLLFARPPPGPAQSTSRNERGPQRGSPGAPNAPARWGGSRAGGPEWRTGGIRPLVQYIDRLAPDESVAESARKRIDAAVSGFGVPLSKGDRETIGRFHRTFINAGLSLKFQSTGRPPRSYYPTYRELLLETDRGGREANFLATEASFQFLKSLHAKHLVIPIVGNLAGDRALAAIGRFMKERGYPLSAFYTSNVELYLSQDGLFPRFVANLAQLPRDSRSVIIRSIFNATIADSVPGYYSASVVQPVSELVEGYEQGRFRSYWNVIER